MHPEQARQSANVMDAFANFFWLPSTSSSLYDPSTPIFILAPEKIAKNCLHAARFSCKTKLQS
jgi:hypothetical protein